MQNSINKNIESGIKWSTLNAVSMLFSKLIRGAIIPKLLAPATYGLFTSINLFTRYLQFADFGATACFIKDIPHYHFNKDKEEEEQFLNETYSLILLSFILISLYLAFAAFSYSGESKCFYTIALLLLIPGTIFLKIKELYLYYALGIQNYKGSTIGSIFTNYSSLFLAVAGVYFYGAIGGVVAMVITEIFLFLFVRRIVKVSFVFSFNKGLFRNWRQMVKQFSVSITELFAVTIDQWFVFKIFKVTGLGIYSLGLTFGWVMEAVSEIFNTATYPKLMAIAKTNKESAIELINSTIMFYLMSCVLMIPLVIYAIEIVTTYYLFEYLEGLRVYSIVLFLGITRGAMALLKKGYIALDKEKQYISCSAINVAMFSLCYAGAIFLGVSFVEVIVVTSIINFISVCVLYGRLIQNKLAVFWGNIGLLLTSLLVVLVYQFLIRENDFVFLKWNTGLIYLLASFLVFTFIAYKNRHQFSMYLK